MLAACVGPTGATATDLPSRAGTADRPGAEKTDPDSALHPYSAALSSGVLTLIAGASLALGRPFTLGIAKRSTPPEIWAQPVSVRTNTVITAVWTLAFAATAAALGVLAHAGQGHSTTATLVQIAGFVVPMLFTKRYVADVQARAGRNVPR